MLLGKVERYSGATYRILILKKEAQTLPSSHVEKNLHQDWAFMYYKKI